MKIRVWKALAAAVVLESVRRKDLWVVAILGFLIMVSAGALGFFGFDGLQSFAKDLAGTVLGIFSSIVAIITAGRVLPDEIKNRTLYPLLARPITRLDLMIGKLLGAIAVTWIAFLMLAGLTGLALTLFQVTFEPVMLQYLVLKLAGLAVLCAVTMALSAYLTSQAAITLSFVLAFGSGMIVRALVMANESGSLASIGAAKFLNALLPQYHLFDLGSRAANSDWGAVPSWVIGSLMLYGFAYSVAALAVGWLKFRKQAV